MKELYDSPWNNPFLYWVFNLLFVGALLIRKIEAPFFRRFFWIFMLEIALDAFLTGGWTPVRTPSTLATVLSIAFVVLGDFRFFLLVEYVLAGKLTTGVFARAIGLSLIIPLVTAPLSSLDSRGLFLIYESSFVVLATLVRFLLIPLRAGELSADARGFLYMLSGFEVVQYLLWAISDVRILLGHDLGHLMRTVPNFLYYAAFLWFAWLALPKSLRERAA